MNPLTDLELAHLLADAAAPIALSYFRPDGPPGIRSKADDSPVSDADLEVEAALRTLLSRHRPDDAVLGEELGGGGDSERCWVIDPIDGTRNYLRHVPIWSTLIALTVGGTVQAGVVNAPALHRRWWAGRGTGAWTRFGDGPAERCRASTITDLRDAHLLYGDLPMTADGALAAGFAGLVRDCAEARGLEGFWSYMLVAEGAADMAIDDNPHLALWDVAALSIVVHEAGGRFAHADGTSQPSGGPAVCANPHLLDAALSGLRPAG